MNGSKFNDLGMVNNTKLYLKVV